MSKSQVERLRVTKRAYSVEEVSEQTSLSKPYLRNKIRDGELPVSRLGRRVLILSEDLEEFLKRGKADA
jgi:excisionase family DNA binding protein